MQSSLHWVGYTFPTWGVTGIRAEWHQPIVSGSRGAQEFTWIGVGGWGPAMSNIIQVGTFAYLPAAGGANHGVWYERVPVDHRAVFPLVGVDPGDLVYASVVQAPVGGDTWVLSIEDVTNGSVFHLTVHFHSEGAYPSLVVEDPHAGPPSPFGPFSPIPRWSRVGFLNIAVRVHSRWVSAASLYADRVDMVRGGKVLAAASPLTATSGFSAVQS